MLLYRIQLPDFALAGVEFLGFLGKVFTGTEYKFVYFWLVTDC